MTTNDQVGVILRAADERFRAVVALAALAVLRLVEAAGLQVGDVDHLRRLLLVRRHVQQCSWRRRGGAAAEARQRTVRVPA